MAPTIFYIQQSSLKPGQPVSVLALLTSNWHSPVTAGTDWASAWSQWLPTCMRDGMFPNLLIGLLFVAGLTFSPATAQVVIRIAPPLAQVELRMARPSRDHVWVPGCQRWDGGNFGWAPGGWERPPRPRARWVQSRYQCQRGGWVFVEGNWC